MADLPLQQPDKGEAGYGAGGLAIGALVAEHHAAVYRYAYRLAGSAADAEDLTQQVFLVAQQKISQVRDEASVRSWLMTVLRRAFLKTCRRKTPIPAGDLDFDLEHLPDWRPERAIDQVGLQAALDELPAEYLLPITMFYFEHASYREIAEALDVPIGTVMSRLSRAKSQLRKRLFDDAESADATFDGAATENSKKSAGSKGFGDANGFADSNPFAVTPVSAVRNSRGNSSRDSSRDEAGR